MDTKGVIESFIDLDDAMYFFDIQIREAAIDNWDISSAQLTWINFHWRVGLEFERKRT